MKNKNFYNVVNKTKLIDVFKKNKVMMNTYFGQLPSTGLYLDFTNEDTYNELVNAAPWVASEPHDDFTIYRRDANFRTSYGSSSGTTLSTTGSSSQDRYGMVTTAGPGLGNKVMYEIIITPIWNGEPVESTKRHLITWFVGNNPTEADHTRIMISAKDGSSTLSIDTITIEGSSTRTNVAEIPFSYGLTYTIKLIWDIDNHTLEFIFDGKSIGTYPFYGESVGYVSIAGTSQDAYKPNSALAIKSIEIKGVQ